MNLRGEIEKLGGRLGGMAVRAKALADPLWGLCSASLLDGVLFPRRSICISIGRGSLSVVTARRFLGKVRAEEEKTYAFEDGRYVQPERLASTVDLAVEEMKARGADVVLALPRDWVISRAVDLPVTVREMVGDVMRYELDRLTPFTADEALYDFRVVGEVDSRIRLSLIAARSSVVAPYLEALKGKGITVNRVTLGPASLGALGAYVTREKNLICLEVTENGYGGCTVLSGMPVAPFFDRFREGAETPQVAHEIEKQTLMMVEQGRAGRVVVLDGADGRGEPGGGLPAADRTLGARELESATGIRRGMSLAGFAGAVEALLPGLKGFNLLSRGVEVKEKVPLIGTLVLVGILVCLLCLYALLPLEREERRLREIDRQITLRKDEARKVEALKKELDALGAEINQIQGFKESHPMTLTIVKELTNTLPNTAWLTRTRVTETVVEIEGYAQSATEILPKLEQSTFFKKAEFASPTIRDTRLNADRFVMKMEQEQQAKKEPEKPKDKEQEKPKDEKKK